MDCFGKFYHTRGHIIGIYPKKFKAQIGKHICTPMLIAASFTVAKILKQPNDPSIDKLIKKAVVHTEAGTNNAPFHYKILYHKNLSM